LIGLKIQIKHERESTKKNYIQLIKSKLFMIKNELETDKVIIEGYVKYAEDLEWIKADKFVINDFISSNIHRPDDLAWKQSRDVIFLMNDAELSNQISDTYRRISSLINISIFTNDFPKTTADKIEKTIKSINKKIQELEDEES